MTKENETLVNYAPELLQGLKDCLKQLHDLYDGQPAPPVFEFSCFVGAMQEIIDCAEGRSEEKAAETEKEIRLTGTPKSFQDAVQKAVEHGKHEPICPVRDYLSQRFTCAMIRADQNNIQHAIPVLRRLYNDIFGAKGNK